jgi:hypothetical protein
MNAKITKSHPAESVVNPLIAFEVEITYSKSKIVILQVSGRLKMNQDTVLVPMVETFTGRDVDEFEGQLAASDSSEDSDLFTESKYLQSFLLLLTRKY